MDERNKLVTGTDSTRRQKFCEEIAELIATGPLYSMRTCGDGGALLLERESNSKFVRLPDCIRRYCGSDECQAITNWETDRYEEWKVYCRIAGRGRYQAVKDSIQYSCKNCGSTLVCYFSLDHLDNDDPTKSVTAFMKTGQWPEPEINPPRDLKLNESNLKLYRRALACRQNSYGIGAIAYLRRVVENSLSLLVDMVIDVCRTSDSTIDADALKKQRYEDKTEFAKSHLPAKLTRGGHNPLSILITFTSEALHSDSDDDCVKKFDQIRSLFEQTYRSLEYEIKEASEYDKILGGFTGGKGKAKKE